MYIKLVPLPFSLCLAIGCQDPSLPGSPEELRPPNDVELQAISDGVDNIRALYSSQSNGRDAESIRFDIDTAEFLRQYRSGEINPATIANQVRALPVFEASVSAFNGFTPLDARAQELWDLILKESSKDKIDSLIELYNAHRARIQE